MVLTSLSPGIGLSDFSLLLQKVHGQLVMETGGTMLRTKNIYRPKSKSNFLSLLLGPTLIRLGYKIMSHIIKDILSITCCLFLF